MRGLHKSSAKKESRSVFKISPMLFFDLETAPAKSSIEKLDDRSIDLFDRKIRNKFYPDLDRSEAWKSAGLYPEFGRIVCATFGFVHQDKDGVYFWMKSFCGKNEKEMLEEIAKTLKPGTTLCGHNSKEFDIPFLCKRMIIRGVQLPQPLMLHGKKPWEVPHKDTMEMWKFGGRSYTSLDVLSLALGIQSPKQDMDGSMVGEYFYNGGRIGEIATYCSRDVLTTANCYFKMTGSPIIHRDTHEIVTP